jgi:RNA-directed DNA polymerase
MKDGVGQLAFTLCFPSWEAKDGTEETQDNGSEASIQPAAARSKSERKQKWHSLIDKVYALPNLQSAWERVRANQGAPGSDGVTIAQFKERAEERLQLLSQELRAKTYRPQPVRRVWIPKGDGEGKRPLGIPTVRDRIVQQALLQILEPIFEPTFSSRSHGFRRERGCTTALEIVDRAIQHGYEWVVDADVQSFFDSVDHERLLTALNAEVADGSVLRLIRGILRAGVTLAATSEVEPTELGTPQGGPLSPLLANVYLHALDVRLVQAGYGLVRYADDFVIFTRSAAEAQAALALTQQVLEGELGLRLHPEKTRVVTVTHGFEFLGYHYFRHPKTGVLHKEVRRKSVRRFRTAVRELTPRLTGGRKPKARRLNAARLARNARVQAIVRKVNHYLRGWHGYFRAARSPYPDYFDRFDRFVRRRLRAVISGRVGDGWWNIRLPNTTLTTIGLVTVQELDEEYRRETGRFPSGRV